MAWKGPKVGEGMLDFVEDVFVGVKIALNLLLYPIQMLVVVSQRK